MSESAAKPTSSNLRVNKNCSPEREINILLLGQTGTGKSTFINALANYLIHDTLDEAIDDTIKVIIPSSFSFPDPETFEEKIIHMGKNNTNESIPANGQSSTEHCRSFVIPIYDRNLRLIDTPGIGDTRGSEQDQKNLFEMLSYISHYEHLNGVCIFLKPNEERLTIALRLCLKQILHYLHPGVSENIIFIFTNARSTFYTPGSSKRLVQTLLNEQREQTNVEIPFSKNNTFLLDNEPLRYLALNQNGIETSAEQVQTYRKSWDYSVKEYERLITYISKRPLHAVANTLSINEAEQLIRKLSRPIAETLRLIQQNIQLGKAYKQDLLQKRQSSRQGLPQKVARITPLRDPRLICVSQHCLRIIDVNDEKTVVYERECHQNCYIDGVAQETINEPAIAQCEVIDKQTGMCSECGCSWKNHMHSTYDYHTNITHIDVDGKDNDHKNTSARSEAIDKHLTNLQTEQANIVHVYKRLTIFLNSNAIHPSSDHIVDYLRLFIQEEEIKNKNGARNNDVIDGLVQIMSQYEEDVNALKASSANRKDLVDTKDVLNNEEVFLVIGTLFRLPINGQLIRDQVDRLKVMEDIAVKRTEKNVNLPKKATGSRIMCTLKDVISSSETDMRY